MFFVESWSRERLRFLLSAVAENSYELLGVVSVLMLFVVPADVLILKKTQYGVKLRAEFQSFISHGHGAGSH